jgi:hypothetical protein
VIKRIFLALIGAIPLLANAQIGIDRPNVEAIEDIMKHSAIIGFSWVDQPLARIILIRVDQDICAVRFIGIRKDTTPHKSTTFTSGGHYAYADYEIVKTRISTSQSFKTATPMREALKFEGTAGVGHLWGRRGLNYITCGSAKVIWLYPTALLLRDRKHVIELAPTKWQEFVEIDLAKAALKWYQLDKQETRNYFVIPINELPGDK